MSDELRETLENVLQPVTYKIQEDRAPGGTFRLRSEQRRAVAAYLAPILREAIGKTMTESGLDRWDYPAFKMASFAAALRAGTDHE